MWMFTRLGFYSVTVNPSNEKQMQVRARAKSDLDKLVNFAERNMITIDGEIREYPQADYPYRVFIDRDEWVSLAAKLAQTVDYTNFKRTVADAHRHDLYMRVWSIMQGLVNQPTSTDESVTFFHV